MSGQEKAGTRKGSRVLVIIVLVVILAMAAVIAYLLMTRDNEPDEEPVGERRNVVVTEENVDEVLDEVEAVGDSALPGYYTVTMNTTWHFPTGSDVSNDAVVQNVDTNTNDVFFDIVLESDEDQVLYKSPVIPRGGTLSEIALDESLEAGTYPCVVIYHLIDEDQNTLSTLRVTLEIVVEG